MATEAFITNIQNELQKDGYKKKKQQAPGYKQHESCLYTAYFKRCIGNDLFGDLNKLPIEVVTASSLPEFKEHLDDTLSHNVYS